MRVFSLKTLFVLLLSCAPVLAFAQGGIFDVPATDKSMQYLGMVFGNVGGLPIQASGNPLFSQLVYYFNQIIFALAIILVISLTLIGTVSTAHEGEIMGKKWSSIIIPARAGLGMYLLLPSANGYNWVQLIVMWFIVQGVGAANSLWNQVINSNTIQGSTGSDTRQADLQNASQAVSMIFNNVVCMQALNQRIMTDPAVATQFNNEFISFYPNVAGDQIQFGRPSRPDEKPICGYVTIPTVGGSVANINAGASGQQRQQILADAIMLAASALEPSAIEALSGGNTGSWSNSGNFVSAARILQSAVESLTTTFTSLSEVNQQAVEDGWIMAGSYYFQLVTGGAYSDVNVSLGGGPMDVNNITDMLGPTAAAEVVGEISGTSSGYMNYVGSSLAPVAPSDTLSGRLTPAYSPPSDVQSVFTAIFGQDFFSDLASDLGEHITTGCMSDSTDPNEQGGDPIICMATFGADLASSIELLFWAALVAIFFIWMGTSVASCVQPLAHTMNFALSIIVPIVTFIIALLWAAGISLALYVPLIPYLVFTFSALAWIIVVIEAVLGAPLIGLTLIVPSDDEIGKAAQSIMLLLGIFFRPPLMMLGFIFAMKLLMVAIGMLNFGFASTLSMSIAGGVGLFGFVSIIILYVGVAIAVVHEAFSLVYILPDKVLRWMGGHQGEGVDVASRLSEMSGAVDKGGAMGAKGMQGALSLASKKSKG